MTASPNQPGRQLIWGGLAARCSMCDWTRTYQPGAIRHQLPGGDRAKAIHSEFERHRCEAYGAAGQRPLRNPTEPPIGARVVSRDAPSRATASQRLGVRPSKLRRHSPHSNRLRGLRSGAPGAALHGSLSQADLLFRSEPVVKLMPGLEAARLRDAIGNASNLFVTVH